MKSDQTVSDLIKAAGGASAVQAELERAGSSLTRDAIYKWQKTGIPDRYWSVIMALADCGADGLYRANCIARHGALDIQEAAE